jgi:AsmA-like C-terminal region
MSSIIKIIRKVLITLCLVLGIIVSVIGAYCYHYQDQIIRKFLAAANKRLSTPIQMSSMQLAVLKSFPNISLILHDVVVKDCTDTTADVIAARKIYCVFDIWKLTQGQYVLDHFDLEYGKICLGEDLGSRLGWKQNVQESAPREVSLVMKLQTINLKEMEIAYSDKQHRRVVNAKQIQASVRWDCFGLEADLQGKATIQHMQLAGVSFAQDLPVALKATLRYDQQQKTWIFQPIQLSHKSALLTIQGSWGLGATSPVALTIQGNKISPQFLLRCLPKRYCQKSKPYDLRGKLTFNLSVNQQPSKLLALKGDFVLHGGAVAVSELSTPIELCQLSGRLSIPDVHNLETATLSVDKLASVLAGSKLEGSFTLRNFHNLRLQGMAEAALDLSSLRSTLPLYYPAITDASGRLGLHLKFEGDLQQLIRGAYARDTLLLSGALETQAAQFRLGRSQLLCKDLVGKLIFKNHALIIQDFSGSIGPGSFVLAGTVQNLLPYLFSDNQKLCVDAQLYMDYLDLDALLYGKHTPTTGTRPSPVKFDIAPHWVLNLDCDIQQLHCRRFQGKNIHGKIKIKDQKLTAEELQLVVSEGKVFLHGSLDASTDDLNIHTVAKLQEVCISNLFYTFENFRQGFLIDTHLSGKVFSDVDLTTQADKQGNMRWDALHAAINFRIIDGGLHDFEPLQRLAKYVDKKNLANLRFTELKNRILIKDRTICIPPMEVYTDPTRIQLSGTHTFDGKIDYSFGIPLAGSQQREGEVVSEEVAATASPYLFFKLQGDIDCYKISYDIVASRKSLAKAIKTQGKVIRALVQGAYQKNKQLQELELDDYFEFDD